MKVRHAKRSVARRTLLLICVGLVVLACGVIAVKFGLLAAADSRAKTSLVDTKKNVVDATVKLNSLIADDKTTQGSKVTALSSYTTQMQNASKDVCSDVRELIYYSLLDFHKSCEAANVALVAVSTAANNLYNFLSDEETLAALLPTNNTDLSYSQQYDLWNRTMALIKSAKTSTQSEALKTAITDAVSKHAAAWYDVAQADNKKDEAAFNKAELLVKTSHAALKATSAVSISTLKDLTATYNTKYTTYTSLTLPN
jgi:hypothetical protein